MEALMGFVCVLEFYEGFKTVYKGLFRVLYICCQRVEESLGTMRNAAPRRSSVQNPIFVVKAYTRASRPRAT